jgi:hypothetical protein
MNPALEKALAYMALRSLEDRWSQLHHLIPDLKTQAGTESTVREMEDEKAFLEDLIADLKELAPSQTCTS